MAWELEFLAIPSQPDLSGPELMWGKERSLSMARTAGAQQGELNPPPNSTRFGRLNLTFWKPQKMKIWCCYWVPKLLVIRETRLKCLFGIRIELSENHFSSNVVLLKGNCDYSVLALFEGGG